MIRQILMTEKEFDEYTEQQIKKGRLDFGRELVEDMWRYAFPGTEYNRHESMDTLWPKFLQRVLKALKES